MLAQKTQTGEYHSHLSFKKRTRLLVKRPSDIRAAVNASLRTFTADFPRDEEAVTMKVPLVEDIQRSEQIRRVLSFSLRAFIEKCLDIN